MDKPVIFFAKGKLGDLEVLPLTLAGLKKASWFVIEGDPDLLPIVVKHNQAGDPKVLRTFSVINAYSDAFMLGKDARYLMDISTPGAIFKAGKRLDAETEDRIGMVHLNHDLTTFRVSLRDLEEKAFNGWALVDKDNGVHVVTRITDQRTHAERKAGDIDTRLLAQWKWTFLDHMIKGQTIVVWIAHKRAYMEKRLRDWKLKGGAKLKKRNNRIRDTRSYKTVLREPAKKDYVARKTGSNRVVDTDTGEVLSSVVTAIMLKQRGGGEINLLDLPEGDYALAENGRVTTLRPIPWNPDSPEDHIRQWEAVQAAGWEVVTS